MLSVFHWPDMMNRLIHRNSVGLCFYNVPRRYTTIGDKYKTKEIEQNATAIDKTNKKLFPPIAKVSQGTKFNSILPPPNITGNLHLGHALMITVLDVICRWKHLNGFDVQLIPGIDHAGIATQVVVEQHIQKQLGMTRFQMGKDAFLDQIWKWKQEKGDNIKNSILQMGTTFNWEKEYFTMDENQSYAVAEAFIRLFEENLIYRRNYLVNWSCSLKSTISDIEVDTISIDGPTKIRVPGYEHDVLFGEIYNISYKLVDNEETITVSTTRPETLFGDTAVAVHPNDERYSHLRSKNIRLWHPFRNETIPLIFDEVVDPTLGTGAVKITPAHSKIDYEIAQRQNLPIISVIDEDGLISDRFTEYAKLPRFYAREKILDSLANMNLFVSKDSHKLDLPMCSRSKDVIELLMKPQWFLNCSKMSEMAIEVVNKRQLQIQPSKFEHQWKLWLEKSIDWCLSRQLWWGHRIPAYQCEYQNQIKWVAAHNEQIALDKAIKHFGADESNSKNIKIKQDDDVLDTWFSSGVLPFTLHGWPKSQNMQNFPLDLLVSGHDILFFWIARMVVLSEHFLNAVPFQEVLLHGIVCDDRGKKMSKSLGNVVTPNQVINGTPLQQLKDDLKKLHKNGHISSKELTNSLHRIGSTFPRGIPECGVDALRFTLCEADISEHFIKFNVRNCELNHRFFNKIWNATKFALMNCKLHSVDSATNPVIDSKTLSDLDKWLLSRLASTISETSERLNNLDVGCAGLWKKFFYGNVCDVYIEASKFNFDHNRNDESTIQCEVLKTCLTIGLRYMSIFTPYLCNEILNYLPHQMIFKHEQWIDHSLEKEMDRILEICSQIRNIRAAQNILRKHGPRNYLFSDDPETVAILEKFSDWMTRLTFSVGTTVHLMAIEKFPNQQTLIVRSKVNDTCTLGISTDINVDVEEGHRKELDRLEAQLNALNEKISSEEYQKKKSKLSKNNDLMKIREVETKIKSILELMRNNSDAKIFENS